MKPRISLQSKIGTPDDVLVQKLQGESVLLNLKTGVYFGLDKTGTRIWNLLQERTTLQEVLTTMLEDYDVAEERCRMDLLELVGKMEEQGLVTVSN